MEPLKKKRTPRLGAQKRREQQLRLEPRDIEVFAAIHRHTMLPTSYVYDFTKEYGRNYTRLQNRLQVLACPQKESGLSFLNRPKQQGKAELAHTRELIHELTPAAVRVLQGLDRANRYTPPPTDQFDHRFMNAVAGASLELAIRRHGWRYIPTEEILAHEKCPAETRASKSPLTVKFANGSTLTPDNLFGVHTGTRYRFYAFEADRGTEPLRGQDRSTWEQKIRGYDRVFSEALATSQWGLRSLTALTLTVTKARMESMIEMVRESSSYPDRYLFKVRHEFDYYWSIPKPMYDLFDEPWHGVDGPVPLNQ